MSEPQRDVQQVIEVLRSFLERIVVSVEDREAIEAAIELLSAPDAQQPGE